MTRFSALLVAIASFGLTVGGAPQAQDCAGFNTSGYPNGIPPDSMPFRGALWVQYIPRTTVTISEFSLFLANNGLSLCILPMVIVPAHPVTGLPDPFGAGGVWNWAVWPPPSGHGPTTNVWLRGVTPITIPAGSTYWLGTFCSLAFPPTAFGTQTNPPGPHLTNYADFYDHVDSTERVCLRLTQTGCVPPPPGPLASVAIRGFAPQPLSVSILSLCNFGLPQPGNASFALGVGNAPANAALSLFWSPSILAQGMPLTALEVLYLDPSFLLSSVSAGQNPALSTSTDAMGQVRIPIPIPNNPALLGYQFTLQAAVADPAGSIQGQQGSSYSLTPALQCTIGN